jgi:tetratricopeptide (TPR) repeat protein
LLTREGLEKAISHYKRSLEIDPRYAPAAAGLARVYSQQAEFGEVPIREGYEAARGEIARALELDPDLAEAHAALGHIKTNYDWDWSGAEAALKRALELEPGNALVLSRAMVLASVMGRFDEALRLGRRAVELDPLNRPAHEALGWTAWLAGHLDEAEEAYGKVFELTPDYPGGHFSLGLVHLARSKPEAALHAMERERNATWRRIGLPFVYHALGRKQEADAALSELIDKNHDDAPYQIAEVHAFRGEPDKAFAWLERAYSHRDPGLTELKSDPLLKNLRADPRYKALLLRMRLPS